MKIFTMSKTWFELPDNFEGSAADALRLMADYLDTPTRAIGPGLKNGTFQDFLQTRKDGGKLLSTGISVMFLNKGKNEWEIQSQKAIFEGVKK